MGQNMFERDPYEILGISHDSEMSVIFAAYKMQISAFEGEYNGPEDAKFLDEIKWAYDELRDAKKRNEYRIKRINMIGASGDSVDVGSDEQATDVQTEGKSEVWSVILSTGLFLFMIGAIGYGLYFVGAARDSEEYYTNRRQAADATDVSGTLQFETATEIPEVSIMHTGTVEALKVTATHEAVVVYSEGLTATNYARTMPSVTPTSVIVQGCPNAVSVNIRKGPSTEYTALGQLLQGDCVVMYGRNEDSSWFVITDSPRPSLNDGWVSSEVMDMDSSGDELDIIYLD